MRGSERPVARNESGLAIVCPHCSAITLHTLISLSNKGQSEHSTMLLLSHLISFHRETYRACEIYRRQTLEQLNTKLISLDDGPI